MKNLLIYISPTGSFDNPQPLFTNDAGLSVEIQIENSLELGWKAEDILLFTNFDFEYKGIKAKVLRNVEFFKYAPAVSKFNAIVELFEKGLIENDELYWCHDLDAFQLLPISRSELKLGTSDMALTGYAPNKWYIASMFFKKSAKDIFYRAKEIIYNRRKINEEMAVDELTDSDESIRKRIKKINITYNFVASSNKPWYKTAIRPIRVAHFHPSIVRVAYFNLPNEDPSRIKEKAYPDNLRLPNRLVKIFHHHGIEQIPYP